MPVYKNEERNTWYCKFNYKDWQGVTRQKKKEGFKTQKEAKAFEREFLEKAHSNPDMTFGSLVALYLEDCKTRLKPTTLHNKKNVIETKILPFFKDMPLDTIEPATIRKWQNAMIVDENNYTQTYLKCMNNHISAIFNFATKYYKLPSNPARVCGSMGKNNADTMQFWTTKEFNIFINVVDKPTTKVMFSILFYTGMRSGELMALTLNDFDFTNKTISINKNYARLNGQDLILEPKTQKSKRTITIPQFLCDMINEYVSLLYDYEPSERLFTVSKNYFILEMKKYCKLTGIKKIRIHDLRHSHASLLIELGFPPLLISERLGHENIQTTLQTYSHLYPNKHSEVADKLEEIYDNTDI